MDSNFNHSNDQLNQYQQGNNPYQQGYPQGLPQSSKKNNKIPIIIGVTAGIIILILIITVAVIALNSNNGDTYNTYNSYYSVEYTQINDGLRDIEKDFYEDGGKIPEKKIPILFEKQEKYLKEQKENGIIRNYTVRDDSIYIEFVPDDEGKCPDPIEYIPGMYYSEYDEVTEPVTEKTTVTTTKNKTPDWANAAVELIYNFPKYGFSSYDTSASIELIDMNDDDIPEITYCCHVGKAGIPYISNLYYFDVGKNKYVNAQVDGDSENATFPILPKEDDSRKLMFCSKTLDNNYLNDYDGYPEGSMFWYYYTLNVMEYKFDGNTFSSSMIEDFSEYREIIDCGDEYSQNEKENAWSEYTLDVTDFNNSHILDESYPYLIVWNINTGYLTTEDMSESEMLSQYHNVVKKDDAKKIINAYKSNCNNRDNSRELDFDDLITKL